MKKLLCLAALLVALPGLADEKPVILEDGAPFEKAAVILEDGAPFDVFNPVGLFKWTLFAMRGGTVPAANWCYGLCVDECGGWMFVTKTKLLGGGSGCSTFGCGCQCAGDPKVSRLEGECY